MAEATVEATNRDLESALFVRRLYLTVLPVLGALWVAAVVFASATVLYLMAIPTLIWLVGFFAIRRRIQREGGGDVSRMT